MARSAKFPCRQPGCGKLQDKPGYCDDHRRAVLKAQKQVVTFDYKERNRFYQRKAWKDVRALVLQQEPFCRACRKFGKLEPATHVDHIKPIEFGGDAFSLANLQSMCKPCHERKTRHDEHCRKLGSWVIDKGAICEG